MATSQTSSSSSASVPSAGPALSQGAAWANLTSVSGAHAYLHAITVLMPLVYPILHQQYGFSYTEIGLLVGVPSFVGGMLQLAFGYLGRYAARKTMIGLGNIVTAVGVFFTGLSTSFAAFMGWGLVRGVGNAPQHPVGSSLLTDTFGRERHGFALAAHVAGGNLGTLVVPFVGTGLILRFGWQPTLMLFAVPGLVAGTAVLLFAREPAPSEAMIARSRSVRSRSATIREFLAPLHDRTVVLIIVASMAAAGGRGVGILTTYLPLYLADGLHLDADTVAALFTLLLAGSVVGPLAAGRLSDRKGRRGMLLLSYAVAALFTIALPLLAGLRPPFWLFVVEIGLLGLTAYGESPLLQAFLADHAPEQERDAAFGWYFTLAFGIGSIWGVVLGVLTDRFGFATTFTTMAISYLVAGAILLFVPRHGSA